jgi:hypothetical protein
LKKLAAFASVVAMAFPTSAAAGEWFYYNYVGPGENNGVCIWYTSLGACSGWNYWFCIKTHVDSGGTVLIGYENTDRIRGVYRSAGGTAQVFPSDVGIGRLPDGSGHLVVWSPRLRQYSRGHIGDHRMQSLTRWKSVVVAVSAAISASVALVGASTGSGGSPGSLAAVANRGTTMMLSAKASAALHSFGANRATLLGSRGHRNFFRIESPSDGTCYGSGEVGNPQLFGIIGCESTPPFPSVGRPLLDLSLVDIERGSSEAHAVRLEGVAADRVARVGAVDTSGAVVAEAAVVGNVYKFDPVPAEALSGLVAIDATGRVVYRLSWSG